MVTVVEEGLFIVGLGGTEAAVKDAEQLEAEFAVAGGHSVAALFAGGEVFALPSSLAEALAGAGP
jgi:hypothetical protein